MSHESALQGLVSVRKAKVVPAARGFSCPHQPLGRCVSGSPKRPCERTDDSAENGAKRKGIRKLRQLVHKVFEEATYLLHYSDSLAVRGNCVEIVYEVFFSSKHFMIINPSPYVEKRSEHMSQGSWVIGVALIQQKAAAASVLGASWRVKAQSPESQWCSQGCTAVVQWLRVAGNSCNSWTCSLHLQFWDMLTQSSRNRNALKEWGMSISTRLLVDSVHRCVSIITIYLETVKVSFRLNMRNCANS